MTKAAIPPSAMSHGIIQSAGMQEQVRKYKTISGISERVNRVMRRADRHFLIRRVSFIKRSHNKAMSRDTTALWMTNAKGMA